MRNYEVVFIIHADLDETAVNAAIEKIKGWITESGGTINKLESWGRKRMAYAINKQREGQYFLIETQLEPAATATLDRNLRFHEPVIRFMITLID